jgi:hypothetical protein
MGARRKVGDSGSRFPFWEFWHRLRERPAASLKHKVHWSYRRKGPLKRPVLPRRTREGRSTRVLCIGKAGPAPRLQLYFKASEDVSVELIPYCGSLSTAIPAAFSKPKSSIVFSPWFTGALSAKSHQDSRVWASSFRSTSHGPPRGALADAGT